MRGTIKLKHKKNYEFLTIFLILPFIILGVLSFFTPLFSPRLLIVFSFAYIIIIAFSIDSIINKLNAVVLIFVIFIALISNIIRYSHPSFITEPVSLSAQLLTDEYKNGDTIVHISLFTYLPFLFYHDNQFEEYFVASTDLTPQTLAALNISPPDLPNIIRTHNRIWMVNIPHRAYASDEVYITTYLTNNARLTRKVNFANIEISLYTTN